MGMGAVVLLTVLCLGVLGPKAEGTWSWFTSSPSLPAFTLPDICGARVFVADGNTTSPSFTKGSQEIKDIGYKRITDAPWPWLVRVGSGAVGVLLSQQHVVTLVHCLHPYTSWYGGFSTFSVVVGESVVEVVRVQVQDSEGGFPLALLTLKENLTWIPAPVCVGALQKGLLATAVGWGGEDVLREEPVRLHHTGQCMGVFNEDYEDYMLCGGPGPGDCGAALLQAINGRWMLIGVGVGDKTPVSRYVGLEQAREWLEKA